MLHVHRSFDRIPNCRTSVAHLAIYTVPKTPSHFKAIRNNNKLLFNWLNSQTLIRFHEMPIFTGNVSFKCEILKMVSTSFYNIF